MSMLPGPDQVDISIRARQHEDAKRRARLGPSNRKWLTTCPHCGRKLCDAFELTVRVCNTCMNEAEDVA